MKKPGVTGTKAAEAESLFQMQEGSNYGNSNITGAKTNNATANLLSIDDILGSNKIFLQFLFYRKNTIN